MELSMITRMTDICSVQDTGRVRRLNTGNVTSMTEDFKVMLKWQFNYHLRCMWLAVPLVYKGECPQGEGDKRGGKI